MKQNKIVKNVFWLYFFAYFALPLGYFLRMLYARQFSVEEYGFIYSIIGIFTLISTFNDFGLTESINYFGTKFFKIKDYKKLKTLFCVSTFFQTGTAVIISIILYFFAPFLVTEFFKAPGQELVLRIFVLYFLGLNISRPFIMIFVVNQNFFIKEFSEPLRLVVTVLVSLVILVYPKLWVVSLAWGLGFIFISVFYILAARFSFSEIFKERFLFDRPLIKSFLQFSWPMILAAGASILLSKTDIILLTYLRNLEEVAFYSNAFATSNLVSLLASPLVTLIFPLVTHYVNNKEELKNILKELRSFLLFIMTPIAVVLLSFPKEILLILFGEKYIVGSLALQILVFGSFFLVLANFGFGVSSGFGKPKIKTKIFYFAVIFNIVGNLILIPIWGYIGAALTTSFCFLVMLIISEIQNRRFIASGISFLFIIKVIFVNASLYLLIYLLKLSIQLRNFYIEAGLILVIAAIFYIGLSFLVKILSFDKINRIIHYFLESKK